MLKNFDRVGAIVGLTLLCTSAHAEIGNPVKRGGAYISVEGGYHNNDAPAVSTTQGETTVINGTPGAGGAAGAGASGTTLTAASASAAPGAAAAAAMAIGNPQVSAATASGTESAEVQLNNGLLDVSRFMSADDGGYFGATVGYAFVSPLLGVVNRIEAYGSRTSSDVDQSSNGAFALRSVDNLAAIALAAVPVEDLQVRATQDLSLTEFGLRLKSDQKMGGAIVTLGAEPFYIRYDQSTRASGALSDLLDASGTRSSDVESDIFGLQLAIEGAAPLGGPFSILGRASAGLYNIDTDADFSSTFMMPFSPPFNTYKAQVSDSDSRTGYRLGAEAGVRYAISSAAWLSVTGSVDYLSETPTAVLPASATDGPASLAFDELLDWRAGARLTFATE